MRSEVAMVASRTKVLGGNSAALSVSALLCCCLRGAVAARTKYVVHYMPWFKGPGTGHWCNADWGNSYYDSALGQYDVSDPFVHTRQLRLLKAAGIDGLWFDLQKPDWLPIIRAIAEEALLLELNFAVVLDNYLDENITNSMQEDVMSFMQMTNYYKTEGGRPLLPLFEAPSRWEARATILPTWQFEGNAPFVIGTYHWQQRESQPLLEGFDSLFFWISNDLTWAENYHRSTRFSVKVGSVYRGWREAYRTWAHTAPYLGFLDRTLEIIKRQEPDFAQIATWNDYTEGTMLEPSFLKGPGGCLDSDDTYWRSDEPCNQVRRLWGPCTPGTFEACAGSGELACSAIEDCTKPYVAVDGPGAAACAGVTYEENSSTLSAYTDLATIARAILGVPLEQSIATFRAIVEEDPPTTTTTTNLTPFFFEPEANGAGYACRGSSEIDTSHTYYALSFGISALIECQTLCLQNSLCTGVEHSSSQSRCEVWTEPIGVKVARGGFACLLLRPSHQWPSSTTGTTSTTTSTTNTTTTASATPTATGTTTTSTATSRTTSATVTTTSITSTTGTTTGTASTTHTKTTTSDSDASILLFEPEADGAGYACRGSSESDTSEAYYTLSVGVPTLLECQALCLQNSQCTGVEHSASHGRCEVWTNAIGVKVARGGFSCLLRLHSSSTVTASTTASTTSTITTSSATPIATGTTTTPTATSSTTSATATTTSNTATTTSATATTTSTTSSATDTTTGTTLTLTTTLSTTSITDTTTTTSTTASTTSTRTTSSATDTATVTTMTLSTTSTTHTATGTTASTTRTKTTTSDSDVSILSFEPEADGAGYACRGSMESDTSEAYYVLSFGVPTLLECQALCLQNSQCTGVEHSASHGRCEVWTNAIGVKVARSGFSCVLRLPSSTMAATTSTGTAVTSTVTYSTATDTATSTMVSTSTTSSATATITGTTVTSTTTFITTTVTSTTASATTTETTWSATATTTGTTVTATSTFTSTSVTDTTTTSTTASTTTTKTTDTTTSTTSATTSTTTSTTASTTTTRTTSSATDTTTATTTTSATGTTTTTSTTASTTTTRTTSSATDTTTATTTTSATGTTTTSTTASTTTTRTTSSATTTTTTTTSATGTTTTSTTASTTTTKTTSSATSSSSSTTTTTTFSTGTTSATRTTSASSTTASSTTTRTTTSATDTTTTTSATDTTTTSITASSTTTRTTSTATNTTSTTSATGTTTARTQTTLSATPLFFEPEADGAGYACRGSSEADTSGAYYALSFGVPTLLECQALCLQSSLCTGVEHSVSHGRCEVWTETIGVKVARGGFVCLLLRPSAQWPSSSTATTTVSATTTTTCTVTGTTMTLSATHSTTSATDTTTSTTASNTKTGTTSSTTDTTITSTARYSTTSASTTTSSATDATPVLFEPEAAGVGYACRGSSETDTSDTYYALSFGVTTLLECQSLCLQNSQCTGVEHSISHGRCEVWTEAIGVKAARSGFTCLLLEPSVQWSSSGTATTTSIATSTTPTWTTVTIIV